MSDRRLWPQWLQRVVVAIVLTGATVVGFFQRLGEGGRDDQG